MDQRDNMESEEATDLNMYTHTHTPTHIHTDILLHKSYENAHKWLTICLIKNSGGSCLQMSNSCCEKDNATSRYPHFSSLSLFETRHINRQGNKHFLFLGYGRNVLHIRNAKENTLYLSESSRNNVLSPSYEYEMDKVLKQPHLWSLDAQYQPKPLSCPE